MFFKSIPSPPILGVRGITFISRSGLTVRRATRPPTFCGTDKLKIVWRTYSGYKPYARGTRQERILQVDLNANSRYLFEGEGVLQLC